MNSLKDEAVEVCYRIASGYLEESRYYLSTDAIIS